MGRGKLQRNRAGKIKTDPVTKKPRVAQQNARCCCVGDGGGDGDNHCSCDLCSIDTCGPCYRITISGTTNCGSGGDGTCLTCANRCVASGDAGAAGTCDGVYHASPTGNPCEWVAASDSTERFIELRLTREIDFDGTDASTCGFRWHLRGYRTCYPLANTCGDCSVGIFFDGISDVEPDQPCHPSSSSSSSTFTHDCKQTVTIDNDVCDCGCGRCDPPAGTNCAFEFCKECFIDFVSVRPAFAVGGSATIEFVPNGGLGSSSSSSHADGDTDDWCKDPGTFCGYCADLTPKYWIVQFNSPSLCTSCEDPCDQQTVTANLNDPIIVRQDLNCEWISDPIPFTVERCDGSTYSSAWTVVLNALPGGAELNVYEAYNTTLNRLAAAYLGASPDDFHACCGAYDLAPSPFVKPYICGDPQGTVICALFQADTVTIAPADAGQDACGEFGHSSSSSSGGGSSSSSHSSSSACPVSCLFCNDCQYCPSDGFTSLTLDIDFTFGHCDGCDGIGEDGMGVGGCFPATGDGCGCCIAAGGNTDCSDCNPPPPGGTPPPDVPCICGGNNASQADCLAGGGTWCCGNAGSGVSDCNGLNVGGTVTIPLVSHTSTTQTYSATILGTDYLVVHTCNSGMVASVYDITITTNEHCVIRGNVGGNCTSFSGSVYGQDTSMTDPDCSGEQGHITGTLSARGC